MKIIDAFGMQCPKPLVLAKKEIDAGCREAVRAGGQRDGREGRLTRLGGKTGLAVSVDEIEGGWLVSFAGRRLGGPGPGSRGSSVAAGASCRSGRRVRLSPCSSARTMWARATGSSGTTS